jgi:ABC-2 type transport system permease protein
VAPTTSTPRFTPARTRRGSNIRVTQVRVMRSEWTKFRSLRSTLYTLGIAVVLMTGLAALFSAITANQPGGFNPGDTAWSTSQGSAVFAQLAIGVLGVLMISGEYSTGSIRSSLTAVPKRLPMLWAKVIVFAAVVFGTMLVASFASFFAGQALLNANGMGVSISDPNALRAVVGAALYLTVVGITGVALGALFRNTAAAISTVVVVFFVLAPLTLLLPASWAEHFVPYLPANAGGRLFSGNFGIVSPLSPWAGFAVMTTYAVVLLGFAAWRLRRNDA